MCTHASVSSTFSVPVWSASDELFHLSMLRHVLASCPGRLKCQTLSRWRQHSLALTCACSEGESGRLASWGRAHLKEAPPHLCTSILSIMHTYKRMPCTHTCTQTQSNTKTHTHRSCITTIENATQTQTQLHDCTVEMPYTNTHTHTHTHTGVARL